VRALAAWDRLRPLRGLREGAEDHGEAREPGGAGDRLPGAPPPAERAQRRDPGGAPLALPLARSGGGDGGAHARVARWAEAALAPRAGWAGRLALAPERHDPRSLRRRDARGRPLLNCVQLGILPSPSPSPSGEGSPESGNSEPLPARGGVGEGRRAP